MTAKRPRHWEEKELLAAQQEDYQTLAAEARLASTPEVGAHVVLLLPPAFRQAATEAVHEDTHAGQQQTIRMARDRYTGCDR